MSIQDDIVAQHLLIMPPKKEDSSQALLCPELSERVGRYQVILKVYQDGDERFRQLSTKYQELLLRYNLLLEQHEELQKQKDPRYLF